MKGFEILFQTSIMLLSTIATCKAFTRVVPRSNSNIRRVLFMTSLTTPRQSKSPSQDDNESSSSENKSSAMRTDLDEQKNFIPPWNNPALIELAQGKNSFRSRQHVNPLARRFQMETILPDNWPRDCFNDMSRPLFIDIGCSRGGFLIDVAKERPDEYNYLGLEIRPLIAYNALQRVERHNLKGHLTFVGCNANVDLERILSRADAEGKLTMVAIQFPDPHFKAKNAKRRVVTKELVTVLAKFMPEDATVFLQSDIQSVLDEMRLQFRDQSQYFEDTNADLGDYMDENIIGIPTEREGAVLDRGLPVYRAVFKRTSQPLETKDKRS